MQDRVVKKAKESKVKAEDTDFMDASKELPGETTPEVNNEFNCCREKVACNSMLKTGIGARQSPNFVGDFDFSPRQIKIEGQPMVSKSKKSCRQFTEYIDLDSDLEDENGHMSRSPISVAEHDLPPIQIKSEAQAEDVKGSSRFRQYIDLDDDLEDDPRQVSSPLQ